MYIPWRDHVDATTIVISSPPERMHKTSHCPLGRLVLRAPRAVEKSSSRTYKDQTGVILLLFRVLSILLDEIMIGKLGRVESAFDVDVDHAELGLLGLFVVTSFMSVGAEKLLN